MFDLTTRIRRRIPRDSAAARVFEPAFRMLTIGRGASIPTLRFVRRHGLTVLAGPFAGIRYPRSAVLDVGGLVPRLSGAYEAELHPAIEALLAGEPAQIVNVGAGDGYYAAGMARRAPDAQVIAYEADPYAARVCRGVVELNGLAERVSLRGACTVEALAGLEMPENAAVICDCEGAEVELIDPERVDWLRRTPLLIEVHEAFTPGLEARLRERLHATHTVESIAAGQRYLDDYPAVRDTPGLSTTQQEMLLSEQRLWHTPWLWAMPRS